MKKQQTKAFNKEIYLLGVDHEGVKYWLQAPSWDCGWYWGFGYVETYTNNKRPDLAKDISSHQHFNGLFLNGVNSYETFTKFFKQSTLTNNEIWVLFDYMKSFYTLKETAQLFGMGNSHFTERAKVQALQREDLVKVINEIMLPELFHKVIKLLTPEVTHD
jgi:hypothetical protein